MYLPLRSWNWFTISQLYRLQFRTTCWGLECSRLFTLQKRALRIITYSKYATHAEPLFKDLKLLKLERILTLNAWNFTTHLQITPYQSTLTLYSDNYEIEIRNHIQVHPFPTPTYSAEHVLQHHIPKPIDKYPCYITDRVRTDSNQAFSNHMKSHIILIQTWP